MLLKLIFPRLIPKAFGSGQCWRMKSVKNHYQRFQPLVL